VTTFSVLVIVLVPWPVEAPQYDPGITLAVKSYDWERDPDTNRQRRVWQLTPTLADAVGFTTEEDARSWMTTITTRETAEGRPMYKPFQIHRGNWPTSLDRAEAKLRNDYAETEGRPLRSRSIMGPRGPLIPGE
jgi:hypothetical protein